MPGFDRTGPAGMGPMTGGGRGRCQTGYAPEFGFYGNRCYRGRGVGRGSNRGFGRGFGRGYGSNFGGYPPVYDTPAPLSAAEELRILKAEADNMKNALDSIEKRISELDKETAE